MNDTNTPPARQGSDLRQLLDTRPHGLFTRRRLLPAVALVVLIAAASWFFMRGEDEAAMPSYATDAVTFGTGRAGVFGAAARGLGPGSRPCRGSSRESWRLRPWAGPDPTDSSPGLATPEERERTSRRGLPR